MLRPPSDRAPKYLRDAQTMRQWLKDSERMATSSIGSYFSSDEVMRLESDLPRLMEWSREALVPFTGERLARAQVVWVNHHWFMERQFDTHDAATYLAIEQWVLDDFGYISGASTGNCPAARRTLYADRYGSSSGLSVHGGSGRAAIRGCFQAKGIGPTPLVNRNGPPGHSHGCLSLAEALRETIYTEVMAAEFPHGTLPIVAIIDTGMSFSSPDPEESYDKDVRRAITVRPAAVRLAHFERAPLFDESVTGFQNIQTADVRRARDMLNHWLDQGVASLVDEPDTVRIQHLVEAIVDQIAFGQLQRLFSGGFFSSNITTAGALLDFGNAHALPDWTRVDVLPSVAGFGAEMSILRNTIHSLAFHFAKYRQPVASEAFSGRLDECAEERYHMAWRKHALDLLQLTSWPASAQDAIHALLRQYYLRQQRHHVRYHFGAPVRAPSPSACPWVYEALTSAKASSGNSAGRQLMNQISAVLRVYGDARQKALALHTAARMWKPRTSLDRRRLLDDLAALTAAPPSGTLDSERINAYVRQAVSSGRRHWLRLADGLGVRAQVSYDGSSALLLTGENGDTEQLWIEGVVGRGGMLAFFDHRLSQREGELLGCKLYGVHWTATVPVVHQGQTRFIAVLERLLRVPDFTVGYDPPADAWLS